jgi:hypothetical protein
MVYGLTDVNPYSTDSSYSCMYETVERAGVHLAPLISRASLTQSVQQIAVNVQLSFLRFLKIARGRIKCQWVATVLCAVPWIVSTVDGYEESNERIGPLPAIHSTDGANRGKRRYPITEKECRVIILA